MKIRLSALLLSLVLLCAALVGCGGKEPEIEADEDVEVIATTEETEVIEELGVGVTNNFVVLLQVDSNHLFSILRNLLGFRGLTSIFMFRKYAQ